MSFLHRRGRRPMFDEPARAGIRLRLTPAQRRDLERVAAENNNSIAGVIRDAVNTFVADYRESQPVFRGPEIKT